MNTTQDYTINGYVVTVTYDPDGKVVSISINLVDGPRVVSYSIPQNVGDIEGYLAALLLHLGP